MQVILLEFARNYLLPQGKAEMATKTNIEAFQARRAELEKQQAQSLQSAQQRAASLEGLTVTITSRSGTEGKLFGSVGTEEIRAAIEAAGVVVEIGEHPVGLHLHADVDTQITVDVVGEEAD